MTSDLLTKIQNCARDLETLRVNVAHLKEDLQRRIDENTPADGWPGKNAETRDAAKAAWINGDRDCNAMRGEIRNLEIRIAALSGELQAFEIERRDREWGVRMGIVEALRQHGVSEALPF